MQIELKELKPGEEVRFNYDELKGEIERELEKYQHLGEDTSDSLDVLREKRASLNKFSKSLTEKRIEVERTMMKPVEDFSIKVKELVEIVFKTTKKIDEKIKEREEAVRQKKLEEVRNVVEEYFNKVTLYGKVVGNKHLEEFSVEQCNRKKGAWLNNSCTIATVKEEMDEEIKRMTESCRTIERVYPVATDGAKIFSATRIEADRFDVNNTLAYIDQFVKSEQATEAEKKAAEERKNASVNEVLARSVENKNGEKLYTCTLRFVGTIESLNNLKEYLEINNDIEFTTVVSAREI